MTVPATNIFGSHYRAHLMELSASSSPSPHCAWPTYQSPIKLDQHAPFIARHPDRALASYTQRGLQTGFKIGYSHDRVCLCSHNINHPSALQNQAVVDDRITAELVAGRLLGPLFTDLARAVHTSPLGLVPKAHQHNRWRLICDLTSPYGGSVNDGISPELCSLQYARVDDAVTIIQQLGRGTQLVKLDLKDAYRIVPVHPADLVPLAGHYVERLHIR